MTETASATNFKTTMLPVVGKEVLRLGIAGNQGIDSDDVRRVAERGPGYFVTGLSYRKVNAGLRDLLKADRERHVVAFLGGGFFGWQVRRSVEGALRRLGTDYLDVYKLGWLGKTSRYAPAIIDTLLALKEEGKVRAIGTSIHDRQRAGRLAVDSAIDLFMIRYSAKHPGAEVDIFPHLEVRHPAVVAYTATAWRQLIRPVKGIEMPPFPGDAAAGVPPLTPALCYRFALSSPHVHVVLTAPKTSAELEQNLEALEAGPLSPEELEWVRDYGRKLKAKKKMDYV